LIFKEKDQVDGLFIANPNSALAMFFVHLDMKNSIHGARPHPGMNAVIVCF